MRIVGTSVDKIKVVVTGAEKRECAVRRDIMILEMDATVLLGDLTGTNVS